MAIKNIISTQRVVRPDVDAVKLIDQIIISAIDERASDIHIEPQREGFIVRYRIDGILKVAYEIPAQVVQPLVSRIKIISSIDTTGLPRPLEGNIKFETDGYDIDLRVSIFPTNYGECIVMRLLEDVNTYERFEDLGFTSDQADLVEWATSKNSGLILVTGPTGSGKSTTLFTLLNKLNEPEKSLVTLEDPVERKLEHVRQTQIDPRNDLTFATGLRYLVRQDPDIIMVGEIRDKVTAQIAVEAAISGQLVMATIHTNNSAGAIIRLLNMGIEPFLIQSSLRLITAQRLARVSCPKCKKEIVPSPGLLQKIGMSPATKFFRSEGCDACANKGIVGRVGIHEVLPITHQITEIIDKNPSDDYIIDIAKGAGMMTLREVAKLKAEEGIIGPEEILRLTD